jgi:Tol biopolymer transport system component
VLTVEGNSNLVSARINRAGSEVAYTALSDSRLAIYTIGSGGGTSKKICENCGQLRAWSPERKIMLSEDDVFDGPKKVAARINRIDVLSGRSIALLENSKFLYAPSLSPDGNWVAFQSRSAIDDRREQLLIAPMSDATPVNPKSWIPITELKYFDANPVFSRDGKIIYFNSDRDGFTCLWAVRLDLATMKPAANPFVVKHFHGSPRHYSLYPEFTVGLDRIIMSLEQVESDLWMTELQE